MQGALVLGQFVESTSVLRIHLRSLVTLTLEQLAALSQFHYETSVSQFAKAAHLCGIPSR